MNNGVVMLNLEEQTLMALESQAPESDPCYWLLLLLLSWACIITTTVEIGNRLVRSGAVHI